MKKIFPIMILAFFIPLSAFANGIAPVLNLFNEDTWEIASIVTFVIILLESVYLRWRIKDVRFLGALWRITLINIASSIVGSAILLAFAKDAFFVWEMPAFILPLFLLTLATEVPLLCFFYKKVNLTWERTLKLGAVMNILSYMAVIVLEIGFFFCWMSYSVYQNTKDLEAWDHPELLKVSSGLIYSGKNRKGHFRIFISQEKKWDVLENSPRIHKDIWDIEGDLCVYDPSTYADANNKHLLISLLPRFEKLHKIDLKLFAPTDSKTWQRVQAVSNLS